MVAPSIDSSENQISDTQTSSDTQPSVEQPTQKLPSVLPAVWSGGTWTFAKIHFTNIFLSLITLGIYGPWAKVRTKRYFYGNTSVFNMAFDFDARPIVILIARIALLITFGVFIYIQENFNLNIGDYSFGGLLFFFLLPILIVRGHGFNARHTTLGNVRFKFDRIFLPSYCHFLAMTVPLFVAVSIFSYWGYNEFLVFPLLLDQFSWGPPLVYILFAYAVITWPINQWWRHRIRIDQLAFGLLRFKFQTKVTSYIKIFVVHAILIGILAYTLDKVAAIDFAYFVLAVVLLVIGLYLLILSKFAYFAHAFWNGIHTTEGSRIEVKFRPIYYAIWITLINHVLIIFTAGLFIPVAKVRRWRYLAKHFKFHPSEELRNVVATPTDMENVIAAEWMDMGNLDFDFGMI